MREKATEKFRKVTQIEEINQVSKKIEGTVQTKKTGAYRICSGNIARSVKHEFGLSIK